MYSNVYLEVGQGTASFPDALYFSGVNVGETSGPDLKIRNMESHITQCVPESLVVFSLPFFPFLWDTVEASSPRSESSVCKNKTMQRQTVSKEQSHCQAYYNHYIILEINCKIMLINKETNGGEFNTCLAEIKILNRSD